MDIRESSLLKRILDQAKQLCVEYKCGGMTRDYILVASIFVLDEMNRSDGQPDGEAVRTQKLLEGYSRQADQLDGILERWRDKSASLTESLILSTQKARALKKAQANGDQQITADLYLSELLQSNFVGADALKTQKKPTPSEERNSRRRAEGPLEAEGSEAETEATQTGASGQEDIGSMVRRTKALQAGLKKRVMGQEQAISVFTAGFFQSELQAMTDEKRKKPRATFLFAGPPGVGKTFLSEVAAEVLGLPFCRFDMSEYTGPNSPDELCGSDANYRGSKEGLLTGFVHKNPRCIILFDEIEKASLEVIHLFLQVLDAGRLRDNRTDKEVEFRDAMLIFTTNAGKSLYEDAKDRNFSAMPRDVILDALKKDINPRTQEPFFPAAICSRFASGNVIMFNQLDAYCLMTIVEKELKRHAENLARSMQIHVTFSREVPSALLYAEGALADARTVKSRADSFFGGELYELFRLLSSDAQANDLTSIREIHVSVHLDSETEQMTDLFIPRERIHVLAWTKEPLTPEADAERFPVIHYARTQAEAEDVLAHEDIRMVFCNLFSDDIRGGQNYLNLEDRDSDARDFLRMLFRMHPQLPVVLLEPEGHAFTEEEKVSYLRSGVRDFLPQTQEGFFEKMALYAEIIFQQYTMTQLARGNQLLRYETAQSIHPDGTMADIQLFDMRLEKAVRAEDADNILSMLSTPDVRFEDVIGAEEAKKELNFFVSYMREPKKYAHFDFPAPKGLLLYGPPGTGKTMLAKAFAAESHATFIATEGNRFFKGVVGEGAALMHKIFATARRYAPSVIFIDEIDTIARSRTGRDTDMAQDSEQILTALFSEMDGFLSAGQAPVFVLGATNYQTDGNSAKSLDPAILRRFDRSVLVDLPNLENRKKFLLKETGAKEYFRLSEALLDTLADRSTGMSLSQLSSVLNLAMRSAMQKKMDYVDDLMMEEAFETYNNGEARVWSRESTLRTARHEAGHTLLSWLSGDKPSYVTIVSRGDYGGYTAYTNQENKVGYTRSELMNRIKTAMGGRAAEIVYYGQEEGISTGASGDLKTATDLAERMLCRYGMDEKFGLAVMEQTSEKASEALQHRMNELLKSQLEEAIRLISEHRTAMDELTDNLLKYNSIRAQDIERIFRKSIL